MPVYTYRCENCGVQFEKTQKFSDALLTVCPECNKKSLRKVYTPVGIVFKGSGFYATDHRSPSGAPRPGTHNEHGDHNDHSEHAERAERTERAESKSPSESSSSATSSSASESKSSETSAKPAENKNN